VLVAVLCFFLLQACIKFHFGSVIPRFFQFMVYLSVMVLSTEPHENVMFVASFKVGTVLLAKNIVILWSVPPSVV
jgi:hypothetical protein